MCKVIEDMRREEREEGREEGRKEGRKEGIQKGIQEMVLRMLETGKYALGEIAAVSGLSLEDVKKLQAEPNA